MDRIREQTRTAQSTRTARRRLERAAEQMLEEWGRSGLMWEEDTTFPLPSVLFGKQRGKQIVRIHRSALWNG